MKLTKDDVAGNTTPVTRITADMVREATEQYKKEVEDKKTKVIAKSAIKRIFDDDPYDDALAAEVNRRVSQEVVIATTLASNSELKQNIGLEHFLGQDLIRDGDDAVDIISLSHYKYRTFVEYDEVNKGYHIYYDGKELTSFNLTPQMMAGVMTQLLDTIIVNSIDNTVAYEDGESVALGSITQAVSNLINNLATKSSFNIKCCLADNKLDKMACPDWAPVPASYLPAGVMERIETEVYGAASAYPTDDSMDDMYKSYKTRTSNIMDSDDDFHGFDDDDDIEMAVWDPHGAELLRECDIIDWRNVTKTDTVTLPKYACDLALPIDVFAHSISDALMYELEPYNEDLGTNYADYITPTALYLLLSIDKDLSSYQYTPTFSTRTPYVDYRFKLANIILNILGIKILNDNSWKDAMAIDLRHLIELSIDAAMYNGTLEISSI